MRKIATFFSAFLLCGALALAQQKSVTGEVRDENGAPIPGATIKIKNGKSGVSAGADGSFSISAPSNATFVISAVGFQTVEVSLSGQSQLNISLKVDSRSIGEVVVTAFGVKREQKSLGYSAQNIKGSEITKGDNGNALGALSGKVAGLQVIGSSGTPGAASYIRLRGVTSFGGGQPLIVIDGAPIDNSTIGTSLGNVAQSNRALDINPDDIETVTVLKGPAAASLYGTEGSDGVIMITTKKGKRGKDGSRFDISYGYGLTFDQINKLPELQNKYIKGSRGAIGSYTSSSSLSWGAMTDTLKWNGNPNQWDPHGNIVGASNPAGKIQFVPYDNAKQFFRTGMTQNHNFAFGTSNDITSFRFSYSNMNQTGIVPLSSFARNTISANVDTKLQDNLKGGVTINYINSGGARVQEGSNLNGLMLGLLRTPISFDNSFGSSNASNLSSYQLSDGTQRSYRGVGMFGGHGYYDNPYWTINKNKFNDDVNRIFGNVYLTYDPVKWLSISERIGLDQYTDSRKQDYALNSAGSGGSGQVIYNVYQHKHVANNLLVTISQKLTKKLNGALVLGNTFYSQSFQQNNTVGTGLTIPDYYNLGNTSSQTASTSNSLLRTKAFFGQAKFEFNNYLFVDVTTRAENSSAFVSDDKKKGTWFFFPSFNGSFIFSDALNMKSNAFNYGKLRLSYGEAGKLPGIYNTSVYYSSGAIADGWTNGLTYPINGQQGFFAGSLGNPNLVPERTSTVDVGTELKFLNNRIGLNYTYYTSRSKNLLLFVPTPPTTGYSSRYTNAAEIQNRGMEVQLNATPVKTDLFSWDITLNWSMNRSKVLNLGPGVDQLFLGGFTNGSINAVKGHPFGAIYGVGYYKDAQGRTIISDGADGDPGYPIVNSNSVPLGDPNPKWIGGIQNSFSYKNFTLSVLFDTRYKFDMWDGTRGALVNFGRAKETENRGQNYVFPGVVGHIDANGNVVSSGTVNKSPVPLTQGWYTSGGSGFTVNEPFIEDATYTKLRELALGYNIDFSGNTGIKKVFKSAYIGVVGRNLFLFTKYKGIDPETSLAGGAALGIDYFNNPGTRSIGFNVKFNL
jgi:TonB-linked SusC/RagA family outer membrane protein